MWRPVPGPAATLTGAGATPRFSFHSVTPAASYRSAFRASVRAGVVLPTPTAHASDLSDHHPPYNSLEVQRQIYPGNKNPHVWHEEACFYGQSCFTLEQLSSKEARILIKIKTLSFHPQILYHL